MCIDSNNTELNKNSNMLDGEGMTKIIRLPKEILNATDSPDTFKLKVG